MRQRLRSAIRLTLSSIAAASLSTSLPAQEPRRGWEVAPYAGLLAFDQDFRVSDGFVFRGLKDSPVFGARAGYTVNRRLALETTLAFSSQSFDPSGQPGSSSLDVSYFSLAGEALAYLTSGNVVPFLAAGLGAMSLDVDGQSAPDQSSTVMIGSFGGGLKLPIRPSVVLRVDARDSIVRQSPTRDVESLLGGEGDIRHNIGLSAGVALRFGGPGDADRDLIYNDVDACPGTPPGSPVDERGCRPEIPPPAPPIKTDRDGDGVSDALDHCPNTRPGEVVDLDGCPVAPRGTRRGESR